MWKELHGDQTLNDLPVAILTVQNQEIVRILATPQSQEQLTALGYETIGSSPEESERYIKVEIAKWAKVIREANLKVQAS